MVRSAMSIGQSLLLIIQTLMSPIHSHPYVLNQRNGWVVRWFHAYWRLIWSWDDSGQCRSPGIPNTGEPAGALPALTVRGGGGKVGELPGGALAPIARLRAQGGVWGGIGGFWNFDTEFTQFSDNFYAKFIPLEMFKYLWNIMFINVSYKSAMFFNLGIQHFLSFLFPFFPPFPLPLFPFLLFSFPFLSFFSFSSPFLFPFLFSFSLSLSFLSPFFPFPIFALLPDFWCRGGQSAPPAPPPPHWLRPWEPASVVIVPYIRDNSVCTG